MKMKAQSAMEYLMTYGWAILIVIIVAAALYALGVFNPATFTGQRTTGFSNLGAPKEWQYNALGEFNVTIGNSAGVPINVSSAWAECGGQIVPATSGTWPTDSPALLGAGNPRTLGFICPALTSGASYNVKVTVEYKKSGGTFWTNDTGTVTGTA